MQLQQELASARGGGGGGQLPAIDRQIQDATRVYQGTKAAMEDAGCYERGFLIFGRGLVRTPEMPADEQSRRGCAPPGRPAARAARRDRRRRRQSPPPGRAHGCACPQRLRRRPVPAAGTPRRAAAADCSAGSAASGRRSPTSNIPISRSIAASTRMAATASVCVRTCDGFFFPISYSDLCRPPGPGCGAMPVKLRRARRALRLPQSRPGDRSGHLAEWRPLSGAAGRLQIHRRPM